MHDELFDEILLPENFYWAWKKAKHFYRSLDTWYDQIEISEFEMNLSKEINSLIDDFKNGSFKLSPLKLLPQPKVVSDHENLNRQAFWVSVRDQVAWLACVNVIGPVLDKMMPHWSYGHRLYRPAWYEYEDDKKSFQLGPYRHSKGLLYRKFNNSWPLYRRHIFLTVRKMSHTQGLALSEQDLEVFERDEKKLCYLTNEFWLNQKSKDVYWASIDCKTFYPSICLKYLYKIMIKNLKTNLEVSEWFENLLNQLLSFHVTYAGLEDNDIRTLDPKGIKEGPFNGLPTNLMVAGFLANVALLDIDLEVEKLTWQRKIAHFRFVDDHTILANSFEDLVQWIGDYQNILKNHISSLELKDDKHQPEELRRYLQISELSSDLDQKEKVKKACKLNPMFPSPLMTKTLEQVSVLARRDFDLLSDQEQTQRLGDLEHMLLTDFPEQEIPERTRVSFAASRISFLAPRVRVDLEELTKVERELELLVSKIKSDNLSKTENKILNTEKKALEKQRNQLRKDILSSYRKTYERSFLLLLEAVERHPEKVRTLERVLDFCKNTGFDGLEKIIDWLNKVRNNNSLAARFLSAKVLQILGKQAIHCAVIAASDDHSFRQRVAALSHLKNILQLPASKLLVKSPRYFETASKFVFQCGLGTAAEIYRASKEKIYTDFNNSNILDRAKIPYIKKVLESKLTKKSILNWQDPREWVEESNKSITSWIWWAESEIFDKKLEHILWTVTARYLPQGSDQTALIVKKHVSHPSPHMDEFIFHYPWAEDDCGWACDFINARKKLSALELPTDISPIIIKANKTIEGIGVPPGKITLYEWIKFCSNEFEKNQFDPRLGEWTALEIIGQIIGCMNTLQSSDPNLKYRPIHPMNFLLNVNATNSVCRIDGLEENWSWENWRYFIRNNKVEMRKSLIKDYRFVCPKSSEEYTRAENAGLALLLLCLLKREVNFSSDWNIPHNQKTHIDLVAEELKLQGCSSLTASIFEACLMPRQWETQLLKRFRFFSGDANANDTNLDPPEINDPQDFKAAIVKAQMRLKENQITIFNNKPRQLIPVSLVQLAGHAWTDAVTED